MRSTLAVSSNEAATTLTNYFPRSSRDQSSTLPILNVIPGTLDLITSQILGGYVLDAFLSPMTLFIKALGLALAVASGLSLGKEVQMSLKFKKWKVLIVLFRDL